MIPEFVTPEQLIVWQAVNDALAQSPKLGEWASGYDTLKHRLRTRILSLVERGLIEIPFTFDVPFMIGAVQHFVTVSVIREDLFEPTVRVACRELDRRLGLP